MIKHGVVMVTLLILTLCLLGVVSAGDVTSSDVDLQSVNQDDSQIEIADVGSAYDESADDLLSSNMELDTAISQNDGSIEIADGICQSNEDVGSVSVSSDDLQWDDEILTYENDYVDYSSDFDDGIGKIVSIPLDVESGVIGDGNYKLGYDVTTIVGKMVDFESAEDILVIATVDSIEIDDVTVENVLNGIVDASNGYVTYGNGNLITLSSLKSDLDIAFFIRKCESLTMAFYKNGVITSIGSGDVNSEFSVCLWDGLLDMIYSWADGDVKGVSFGENQGHFLSEHVFEQYLVQTLLGCNNGFETPINNCGELLGALQDTGDDAIVWSFENVSDETALISNSIENESVIGLIMENNNSDNEMIAAMSYDQSNSNEMLKVDNLNPEVGKTLVKSSNALTPEDIKQIGVDASKLAIAYFKSRGINVKKDYENFYIFTSAGYAKIRGLNTDEAIDGIIQVFGPKIIENIYLVHTSLWKDLIFYFIWVNSANNEEYISYSLKYVPGEDKLVVDGKSQKQGDKIAYKLDLISKKSHHGGHYHYNPYIDTVSLNDIPISLENLSSKDNTTHKTKSSGVPEKNNTNESLFEPKLPETKVNPYNILYTMASIFMVCAFFGVSYSKR